MNLLPKRPPAWTIIVAGGGIPALAFAIAAFQAARGALAVEVVDPSPVAAPDGRAFALSPGAVAMLSVLGVWTDLARHAQPVRAMTITDARTQDAVRPDYLHFGGPDGPPLAFLVEASQVADALLRRAADAGIGRVRGAVTAFSAVDGGAVTVATDDGQSRRAALLVAADGSRSRLREQAGIGWVGTAYGQRALVATVSHERPHDGVAVQHFLPGGPFAILPLAGPGQVHPHRSSIVWSERADVANAVLASRPDARTEALRQRFGTAFGAVAPETPLTSYPLSVGLARRLVGPRFALLGDAAHVVHPLAGQGLNLALADAAALAEAVVGAARLGLDPGGPDPLAGFERDRRLPAVTLAAATDGLNRLFSNDLTPLRFLRDLGLGLVDRVGPAKGFLVEAAAGRSGREPRLMRGETI